MINLIICLTMLNIAMNCSTAEDYNRQISKINNIFAKEPDINGKIDALPCQAINGDKKDECNNINMNVILKHYHVRGIK